MFNKNYSSQCTHRIGLQPEPPVRVPRFTHRLGGALAPPPCAVKVLVHCTVLDLQ